jgi:hypothetical protein
MIPHDWNDDACLDILRDCRRALQPSRTHRCGQGAGGSDRDPGLSTLTDLMAVLGGKERALEEFQTQHNAAGFRFNAVKPTAGPFVLIEAMAEYAVADASRKAYSPAVEANNCVCTLCALDTRRHRRVGLRGPSHNMSLVPFYSAPVCAKNAHLSKISPMLQQRTLSHCAYKTIFVHGRPSGHCRSSWPVNSDVPNGQEILASPACLPVCREHSSLIP